VIAKVHIGCCGWSYLREEEFSELRDLTGSHSKLRAYARLFDSVEINSSFYRLPRLSTAEKWRNEVDEINPAFEFTVKAFKGITHLHRFQKKESLDAYDVIKGLCAALHTRIILFQSPASFKPSQENIDNMTDFFDKIDRRNIITIWEPRGKWYDNASIVERVCQDCKLVHCVDPFRNDPLVYGKSRMAYFRLHGFGSPSMYRYDFSMNELHQLCKKIDLLKSETNDIYVFFNNETCYRNGRIFQQLIADF